MWIRLYREKEDKEILINLNSVWKIEVSYVVIGPNRQAFDVGLEKGLKDADAIRVYKLYFGSDTAQVIGSSDSPAVRAIQDIYEKSLKGK
jgi:hypothetical protein